MRVNLMIKMDDVGEKIQDIAGKWRNDPLFL
jgi:hypothetical protein